MISLCATHIPCLSREMQGDCGNLPFPLAFSSFCALTKPLETAKTREKTPSKQRTAQTSSQDRPTSPQIADGKCRATPRKTTVRCGLTAADCHRLCYGRSRRIADGSAPSAHPTPAPLRAKSADSGREIALRYASPRPSFGRPSVRGSAPRCASPRQSHGYGPRLRPASPPPPAALVFP